MESIPGCHPEWSELEIPRCARNDNHCSNKLLNPGSFLVVHHENISSWSSHLRVLRVPVVAKLDSRYQLTSGPHAVSWAEAKRGGAV